MYWNSSGQWNRHRHHRGGNGWVIALVILGLIILTHGWILLVPLFVLAMGVAAFAFFGFVLPKLAMHAQQGGWQRGDWSCGGEKRKNDSWGWDRAPFGEKPKRDDNIDYV